MGWSIHLHLVAAIAWIGGGFFMFALGVMLRDKSDQQAVYPRVGPIYGWYETLSLIILISTGLMMIYDNGLIWEIFSTSHNKIVDSLRLKLILVLVVVVLTVLHMSVSLKANGREKSRREFFISKTSSMGIFILNLVILHYAMVLRSSL